MKRFLIVLFLCVISFGSKAQVYMEKRGLLGSIRDSVIGDIIGGISEDAYFELFFDEINLEGYSAYDKDGNLKDVDFINYPGVMAGDGHNRVDDKIRPYIDQEDADFIRKYTRGIYDGMRGFYADGLATSELYCEEGSGEGLLSVLGSYAWGTTVTLILRNDVVESDNKALIQDVIHHLLQYIKDSTAVANDFADRDTKNNWKGSEHLAFDHYVSSMTQTTEDIFHGILNARAYSEEMFFLYNKKEKLREEMKQYEDKKAEYEQFEKRYKDIVSSGKNPAAVAFDKAIRSGKNAGDARRAAAIALLDSDLYLTILKMGRKLQGPIDYDNDETNAVSADEIMRILGSDMFSLEDLYQAEKFWLNVCDYEKAINSKDCDDFWARYETKYCPELREKWGICARLKKVIDVEKDCKVCKSKSCSSSQKVNWTDKEDADAYKACCTHENFPLAR